MLELWNFTTMSFGLILAWVQRQSCCAGSLLRTALNKPHCEGSRKQDWAEGGGELWCMHCSQSYGEFWSWNGASDSSHLRRLGLYVLFPVGLSWIQAIPKEGLTLGEAVPLSRVNIPGEEHLETISHHRAGTLWVLSPVGKSSGTHRLWVLF